MALPNSTARFVHYRLTADDVLAINNKRRPPLTIAQRIAFLMSPPPPSGFLGSSISVGDIFPMLVTAVRPLDASLNGQVFLDGNDNLWVQNVREGTSPGNWTTLPPG